jgi:HSP20 family protein
MAACSTSGSSETRSESPGDKVRDVVAGWIDMVASQGERAIDVFGLRGSGKPWLPCVDIVETAERVVVAVDLPGIDPDRVEILLVGNMLTVKGDQFPQGTQPGETVHRRERPCGTFSRSIPLPVAVDPEKVSADARHGVLTITLAKAERCKVRQIPIGVKTAGP